MSMITSILEILTGKIHIYLSVGGSPAVEIVIRDKEKEIVADIKNPILAIELGLQQIATKKKMDSYVLNRIKDAGYKIKVKYKMLEMEI
jgi:hypothetical protein